MASEPYWHFYPRDWMGDPVVKMMSYEQQGLYFNLLLVMRDTESYGKLQHQGKPMPPEMIGMRLGWHGDLLKHLLKHLLYPLLDFCLEHGAIKKEQDTGILYNSRLVRDFDISSKRKKAGSLGGKAKQAKGSFAIAKVVANVKQNRDNDNDSGSGSSFSSPTTKDRVEKKDLPYAGKTSESTLPENTQLKFKSFETNQNQTISNEINQNQMESSADLDFLDRIAKTPMAKEYSKVIDLRTKFAEFCEAFVAEPNESRNAAWREFYNLVFWQQSDVTSDQLIQCAKNYHEYMEEAGRLKKYMAAFLRDKIYKEFLVKPKYVKPVAKMNKVEKSIHEAVQMRKAKYGQ